jgi:hypothetical protein
MPVPAVPPQGNLEQYSLAAVLRTLLNERRDGCLTVVRGTITRRLYLRGGMIIYGSSTDRQDRLGEILTAQGKLSKADHKRYWEQSKADNRLLGITLVVNDRITLSDLYMGVTAQVVTILERLQKWRKGEYSFEAGLEPAAGTVLLRIPLSLYLGADAVKKSAAVQPAQKKLAPKKSAPKKSAAKKPAATGAAKGKSAVSGAEAAASGTATPGPAGDTGPGAGSTGPGAAGNAAVEETIELVSADQEAAVGEVSVMVQELRKRIGQGPFALLGVPPGADRAAVNAAFHCIAKVLHPDRIPAGCSPELAREAEEVYHEVAAAAQAAEGEARGKAEPRAVAATSPQPARPAPTSDDQARRFFQQGREWIAKRNYWQAADALRQAVRLKPAEPTYRQYLGLALMQTKRIHEAEEHLVEATRLEPNNPAHFVNLGRIYRGGRLYKKAREAFERALRMDPRDEHAREELRDLPEEPPARRTEGVGLLKKLFGKG